MIQNLGRSIAFWAALALSGLAGGEARAAALQVAGANEAALLSGPVAAGARWCLVWNHSVTGEEVRDCFREDAGQVLLERSHQIDFSSAGLGYILGRGTIVPDGQGGQWIENINEPVPETGLVLRVGTMGVNHRLVLNGATHSLSALAENQRVIIQLVNTDD